MEYTILAQQLGRFLSLEMGFEGLMMQQMIENRVYVGGSSVLRLVCRRLLRRQGCERNEDIGARSPFWALD